MRPERVAVTRWLTRSASPEPLAALRIGLGAWAVAYLVARATDLAGPGGDPGAFRPVGVVSLLLDSPYGRDAGRMLVAAAVAAGVAFTLGWRFRVSGPVFALLLLWVTTWRNSWTQVFHTENLLVLHVALLAVARSADAWSLDARRAATPTGRSGAAGPDAAHGWPVRAMAVVTVATYVVAGLAKLRHGGLAWAGGGDLRQWVAFDNLRKIELGDVHSPLGAWLSAHGWVWPPAAVATLAIELGAPVALLGGRAARLWSGAAWLFHAGVLALMAILFPYPLTGAAFAPLLCLGRGGQVVVPVAVAAALQRRRRRSAVPAAN